MSLTHLLSNIAQSTVLSHQDLKRAVEAYYIKVGLSTEMLTPIPYKPINGRATYTYEVSETLLYKLYKKRIGAPYYTALTNYLTSCHPIILQTLDISANQVLEAENKELRAKIGMLERILIDIEKLAKYSVVV